MSNTQKKINHLAVLEQKHQALEKEIELRYKSFADDTEVTALKLKKLQIKQDIEQLKAILPK
jgi:hypothetical protein